MNKLRILGSWPQLTSKFWRCSLSMNRHLVLVLVLEAKLSDRGGRRARGRTGSPFQPERAKKASNALIRKFLSAVAPIPSTTGTVAADRTVAPRSFCSVRRRLRLRRRRNDSSRRRFVAGRFAEGGSFPGPPGPAPPVR